MPSFVDLILILSIASSCQVGRTIVVFRSVPCSDLCSSLRLVGFRTRIIPVHRGFEKTLVNIIIPHIERESLRLRLRSSLFIWKGRKKMAAATENVTLSPILDTIDVLNQSNGSGTGAKAFVARTDGMLLSYSFLLLAALLCVYFGAYRSVTRKDAQKKSGEKPDVLTAKDGNHHVASSVFISNIVF